VTLRNRPITKHNAGDFADTALAFRLSIKRLFDIVGAATSLVLLSPLFLIISVAIKLESRGPIFFRQIVFGYENRTIRVLKFRSIAPCGEANSINSCATWVGGVLRRTGLDELPKLFNVLCGDMTIVGPRPYGSLQNLLGHRVAPLLVGVRPGLTGCSQIFGPPKCFMTTEQRINDDLHYIKSWSLFLDIKIILMNVFC
jgi:lipopolysaccharide/colanic/teichoic acid biosynthesis glycosyltransferase